MSSSNLPLTRDLPAIANAEPTAGPAAETAAADQADATSTPDPQPGESALPDELAAAAVELARQAAEETAEPNTVGQHLGVTVDDGGLTMHSFACTARGYRGWRWAVTLARAPGFDTVTVCDVVLLPGADSIRAPEWVPWSDRLAPGDLGAGDDLPYRADDPNLVPGYTITDPDDADQELFWELGLGRERVVGLEGLQAAAERWQHGPHGPSSEIAVQASAQCVTCAYFVPVSGFLRQNFGACTNEWSPADGTVVTLDFGCGAHSETDLELPAPEPLPEHILDESQIEVVVVDRTEPAELAEEPEPVVEAVEPVADVTEPESGEVSETLAGGLEPVREVLEPAVAEPEPVLGLVAEAAPEAVVDPGDFVYPGDFAESVEVAEPAEPVAEPVAESASDQAPPQT